jgi:hypothetical protein
MAYRIVDHTIWTGQTGKAIQHAGPDAFILALYLITGPESKMTGLFYCPIEFMDKYLKAGGFEGASKPLRSLQELGFCRYDSEAEVVWVVEMARFQCLRAKNGFVKALDKKDNRVRGIASALEEYSYCTFYGDFIEKYGAAFHLQAPEQRTPPFEAPSKPLRSIEQEQEQEKEQEQRKAVGAAPGGAPPGDNSGGEEKAAEILMSFPCSGKVRAWNLTRRIFEDWQDDFAELPVLYEARMANVWLKGNPSRKKTASGMPRFFANWLARETNRPDEKRRVEGWKWQKAQFNGNGSHAGFDGQNARNALTAPTNAEIAIWDDCLNSVKADIGNEEFESWFAPLCFAGTETEELACIALLRDDQRSPEGGCRPYV